MKLEIKNNNFIEIDDLIKVNNISCKLDEYQYENGTLKGQFQIQGEYIKDSSSFDKPFNFFQLIPFEIVFVEKINEITNIYIGEFEYFEVERRGIETEINIVINDEETDLDCRKEEDESIRNETNYEIIKDEAENEIANVLDQTFSLSDVDNNNALLPTSAKRTIIKIFGNNK